MKIGSDIQNVIFDFGGVILNIDYTLSEKAFQALGIPDFHSHFSQAKQSDLFDALETGKISPAAFRDQMRTVIGMKISDAQIDRAWNAMLLDLPRERVDLLDRLKSRYRIFLLSNTNQIHYDCFSSYMKQQYKRDLFSDLFVKAYLSHEIGRRKPDVSTFKFVLDDAGINAGDTLFIDDSPQHVEGAKQAGLQAIFLEKGKDICSLSWGEV